MKTVQRILDDKGQDVWSVHPDDTVFDAIQMMSDKDVGALVVIENDRLVGIFSERDYARNVILLGKSSAKMPVREIMVTRVVCTRPEQTVEECMALMTKKRIRHLPVLHDKQLVGMVTIGDVVKCIIEDQQFTIDEIYNYIHTA